MEKIISILGSTGSIGTQSLTVCKKMGYRVKAITAHSNWKLMEEQIRQFNPEKAVLTDMEAAQKLKEAVSDTATIVLSGMDGVLEVASDPQQDTVINALMGVAGLKPTVCAIEAGNNVALANKETLVAGGKLVTELVKKKGVLLTPIDSEHSAIFQCLQGNESKSVKRLIITASGGPFYGKTRSELAGIKKEQALKHPNWSMGAKITIDSSTLMNKGLEFIEAMWLFSMPPEKIDVVVHPQSIIHSMVEYVDGSVMAQMGAPDMMIPIQYALTWPHRYESPAKHLDLLSCGDLTFKKPDTETFTCLADCIEAAKRGGLYPCVLNGANEEAVSLFLQDKIGYLDLFDAVRQALDHFDLGDYNSVEEVLEADRKAREFVRETFTR
ncbi:1-deoxy-D-xylulose-5-phosphate reductoisomerase [Negativibacillus massiliensis]|uniref:1-deoxy-D-xylulose-5-phosphate reductoisomerase n=1 Tax=Negativibacillus massiliensis TaxID=1871035 RepID=UPI003AF9C760